MLISGVISIIILLLLIVGVIAVLSNIIIFPLALYRGFTKKGWKLLLISILLFGGGIIFIIISSFLFFFQGTSGLSPLQQTTIPRLQ